VNPVAAVHVIGVSRFTPISPFEGLVTIESQFGSIATEETIADS